VVQTTTPESLKGARQAAQIAGRFWDLQGLRQAAAGAGLLCLGIWEMTAPLSRDGIRAANMGLLLGSLAVVIFCFGLAMAGVWRISVWYRTHYGRVEQTTRQRRLGRVIGATGVLAFLVPFNVDSIAANTGQGLPVNLMLFTLSLWIVGYWLYLGRPFWHYPVMACIGLALGLVSIAGIPPNTFAWHVREATLYFALATIIGGLIDHMILTRSLAQPESTVGLES
jgi:hypothetical protein